MDKSLLPRLILRQAEKYGDKTALTYRDYASGTWIPVSWNQFAGYVRQVANALIALGVAEQENLGVFSQNKPECLYVDFGAFAEILPGVDGLIHISQVADHRVDKVSDVLSEGQEVEAKIIDIDTDRKRISLSIRALLEPAAEKEAEEESAE